MINTYNETELHRTLKEFYHAQYGGETEAPLGGSVCDILAADGTVIEIQTTSTGKLLHKIEKLAETAPRVIMVYPLVKRKYIETRDESGARISYRRSPKKQDWPGLFRNITGIAGLLGKEFFILEVPLVTVEEQRIRTADPIQLPNRSRRFKKNWYKAGKRLLEIHETKTFSTKDDYLALLPALPETFSTKTLKELGYGAEAQYIAWVLKKAGFSKESHREGRAIWYRLA